MKKIYTALLLIVLTTFFFAGCNSEKPTAADSVEAIYDLYILGDTSAAATLGMSEEEAADALTTYDETLKENIRSNYSASGLEIDDETIHSICEARKGAFSRMKADFTVTSEEGSTAVVTINTTYFDEILLDTNAFYEAKEEANNLDFADDLEYQNYTMDAYTENLIEAYRNITPSSDTKTIAVTCTIINNAWLPEDIGAFYEELALTITGQIE